MSVEYTPHQNEQLQLMDSERKFINETAPAIREHSRKRLGINERLVQETGCEAGIATTRLTPEGSEEYTMYVVPADDAEQIAQFDQPAAVQYRLVQVVTEAQPYAALNPHERQAVIAMLDPNDEQQNDVLEYLMDPLNESEFGDVLHRYETNTSYGFTSDSVTIDRKLESYCRIDDTYVGAMHVDNAPDDAAGDVSSAQLEAMFGNLETTMNGEDYDNIGKILYYLQLPGGVEQPDDEDPCV